LKAGKRVIGDEKFIWRQGCYCIERFNYIEAFG